MGWTGTNEVLQSLSAVVNTLLHQCVAVILIYSIWGPLLDGSQISWHGAVCSVAIFPFMAEAVALFSGQNVWTYDLDKPIKIWIHGILMFISLTLTVTGVALGIDAESSRSGSHFSSPHGILGLIFLILIIFSVVIGVFARFSKTFKGYAKPVTIQLTHNIIGILTYVFAISSLCTGYYTDSFVAGEESKNAATVVSVIVCVWSLASSLKSLYSQIGQLV